MLHGVLGGYLSNVYRREGLGKLCFEVFMRPQAVTVKIVVNPFQKLERNSEY